MSVLVCMLTLGEFPFAVGIAHIAILCRVHSSRVVCHFVTYVYGKFICY